MTQNSRAAVLSDALNPRKHLNLLVGPPGLEPGTNGLRVLSSALREIMGSYKSITCEGLCCKQTAIACHYLTQNLRKNRHRVCAIGPCGVGRHQPYLGMLVAALGSTPFSRTLSTSLTLGQRSVYVEA